MATTVFTTWASLRDFLLDKLAGMDPSVGSVTIRRKEITFQKQRKLAVSQIWRFGDWSDGTANLIIFE